MAQADRIEWAHDRRPVMLLVSASIAGMIPVGLLLWAVIMWWRP